MRRHLLVITGHWSLAQVTVSWAWKGVKPCSWDKQTKIAMSKESGRRIVLLHADSWESKKTNQLALIAVQLFVNPAQDATAGEMRVKSNKIWNEVRYLATAFLVMKVRELQLKEVFTEFLSSERPCKLQRDVRDQMCTVLDNDDQDAQSISQMETAHVRQTQKPQQVPSSSRQEEKARPRSNKNLARTVQNPTRKTQNLRGVTWSER